MRTFSRQPDSNAGPVSHDAEARGESASRAIAGEPAATAATAVVGDVAPEDILSRSDAAPNGCGRAAPVTRKLRILQVTHDLNPGGLQRVVLDLSAGLIEAGHDVHICSLRGRGPLEAEIWEKGIPLWAMPWPERGVDRGLFLKVTRLLRKQRYDVIHTHNTQAFLDGGLAALLARVPARIHTDHARPFPDKLRYMVMERLMSFAYQKIVGVSAHTASNLRRHEGIAPSKLSVILNGINGSWYRAEWDRHDRDELRRAAGLEGFAKIFGLGVRLEEQKGIRYLIEAMPEILRRHPDVALAVAGSGSQEESLRRRAEDLGVGKHVRFLGSYPQLSAYYPLLDFFVLPSLWEGLPLCLLEAMSLGLPIVASKVGGVGDLLEHGRTGLLTEPADAPGLASAVSEILDDFPRAQSMGLAARAEFDARYDSTVMVRRYSDLYLACLSPKKAGAP